ncbi:MAG: HNH endonuclease, partial [Kiritimatiellaeota bacterium]|nr:HNH endonuclease [Kiritimatiellota bacterium]
LLEAKANRELGNAPFAEKREAYRKSTFAITRKLAEDYDCWTPEKLQARQRWMARQARSIWSISF